MPPAVRSPSQEDSREHLRRREHQGRGPGHQPHQPGPVPRAAQPGLRHPGGGRHQPQPGRRGDRGHPGLRHRGRGGRGHRGQRLVHLGAAQVRRRRHRRGRRRRRPLRGVHHRGHPGPGRGPGLQPPGPGVPRHPAARAQLPGHHLPGQVQHRHHLGRHRHARRPGGHREPVGHPHLPGPPRALPAGGGPDHLRGHRRRPGARAPASSTAWPPSRPTPTPGPS